MTRIIVLIIFMAAGNLARAQKVDSIYFHLYTDSLKKGQHNYINVDGKLSNGKWVPLSEKELEFRCSEAKFEGNELIIPENFRPRKITVRASLKSDPAIWKEVTIWIKQMPDPPLPNRHEILKKKRRGR